MRNLNCLKAVRRHCISVLLVIRSLWVEQSLAALICTLPTSHCRWRMPWLCYLVLMALLIQLLTLHPVTPVSIPLLYILIMMPLNGTSLMYLLILVSTFVSFFVETLMLSAGVVVDQCYSTGVYKLCLQYIVPKTQCSPWARCYECSRDCCIAGRVCHWEDCGCIS